MTTISKARTSALTLAFAMRDARRALYRADGSLRDAQDVGFWRAVEAAVCALKLDPYAADAFRRAVNYGKGE